MNETTNGDPDLLDNMLEELSPTKKKEEDDLESTKKDQTASPSPEEEQEPQITVEAKVKSIQETWRAKAKSVKFENPKDVIGLYKQARRIDQLCSKSRLNHDWTNVYYLLHLYLELAMRYALHKPSVERLQKEGKKVFENLTKIEERLNTAKKGITWQLENQEKDKRRKEEEAKKLGVVLEKNSLLALDALKLSNNKGEIAMGEENRVQVGEVVAGDAAKGYLILVGGCLKADET